MPAKSENVRVVVRFRPHNDREKREEKKAKLPDAPLDIMSESNMISVAPCSKITAIRNFNFDGVLDANINQEGAFSVIAHAPCIALLDGYNSTIFVYGQTGSGKSYTMLGPEGDNAFEDPVSLGLIPRSIMLIFSGLEKKKADGEILDFQVSLSFLEIYLEAFRDLQDPYSKKRMRVRLGPNGDHFIPELLKRPADCVSDVFRMMTESLSSRTVSATKMNQSSSRSHMVMMVLVRQDVNEGEKRTSTLNFADLAGSEKMKKTEARGIRAEEAKKINLSLTQLGIVISELAAQKSHVSFRDSALTQVLQDSLGGNCKTTLIVNCSKSLFNRDEAIGSLEFGRRCKTIKTKAKVNQQFSRKQLLKMLDDLRFERAALVRKIENEEFELAKNNVDESVLAEKLQTITALREESDEKNAEIDALKELNEEINAKLTASRFQTMGFRKQSETLRTQIEDTRTVITKLEQDIAQSHAEVRTRTDALELLKHESAVAQTAMSSVQNDLKLAQEKLAMSAENESVLSQKIEILQVRLASTEESAANENSESLNKLTTLNQTLETQLNDTRVRAEGQQERILRLEETIEQLEATKARLERNVTEFTETLNKEQTLHQEARFKWSMDETDLRDRITELEQEVDDMTEANETRAKEWQRASREKDAKIASLERQLGSVKAESMVHVQTNEKVSRLVEDMSQNQKVQLSLRDKEILEKEEHVKALDEERSLLNKSMQDKMTQMEKMQNSLAYLENFNKTQLEMLEAADHAFAQALFEQEQRKQSIRLQELKERELEDLELAKKWQQEYETRASKRKQVKQNLNIEPFPMHSRTPSIESTRGSTVRGTRRKKFANSINLEEKVKLHNGMKGYVKFQGHAHFNCNQIMVGIHLIDGEGDCDGTKRGYTYFQCPPNRGKFVTLSEVSHVYRPRGKDGKEEKLRFSQRDYVNQTLIEEGQPSEISPHRRELSRMTTDAQIQLAIQQSEAQQFVSADAAFEPTTADDLKSTIRGRQHEMKSKKAKFKKLESERLMRSASVQILNEIIDGIDEPEQKKMVFDEFVELRNSMDIVE